MLVGVETTRQSGSRVCTAPSRYATRSLPPRQERAERADEQIVDPTTSATEKGPAGAEGGSMSHQSHTLRPRVRGASRPRPRLAVALISCLFLSGCSAGEEGQPRPSNAAPAPANQELATPPTFDADRGIWLSDGWPVPAPDATFDPEHRWKSANEIAAAMGACLNDRGHVPLSGGFSFPRDDQLVAV